MPLNRGAMLLTCVTLSVGAVTVAARQSAAPATARTATRPPAADAAPRYLTPPKAIVDILDASPLPTAALSPSRDVVALVERRSLPPIAELAQPMLRLAGFRVNPRTNGPHRTADISGITLKSIATGAEHPVTVPAGSTLLTIGFSPDGKRYAFGRYASNATELWMADVATGKAARLGMVALNNAGARQRQGGGLSGPCEWLDDGSALSCLTVPASRGPVPAAPAAPEGPNIQETSGKAAPVRTYQDLLTSAHDEALFEYFFTSQLALIDPVSGKATPVGKPAMIEDAEVSPSGQFVLVTMTKRPFSRLVPRDDFPKDVEVWSRAGANAHTIAHVPSGEPVPITGVITGPRGYRWQPTVPATVVWVEALDGGDLKNKVPHRDRIVSLAAPFTGAPAEVIKTEYRFNDIAWTDRGVALVTEFDRQKRWTRTWLLAAGGTAAPRKLWDLSREDAYADPGEPLTRRDSDTILQHGDAIYLKGDGASSEGDRPFLDRLNLTTLQTERLFRCDTTSYETVTGLLAEDGSSILTRRESKTDPPNYMVRTLKSGAAGGAPRAITAFKDPAPQLAGVTKQLIRYKRADGLDLSATLYLPPGYKQGTPLPTIAWAYPREFTSAASAGQVRGSANRFTTITGASHLLLLTQGYAILDDPKIPIIGEGETANDTYVEQLVSGAKAAIDAAVALGVTDRDRVGVGGHSYGAFMTANLLAHSDLFRMGIARSGAYNRTLTPFGFQAETRSFWEVPEIYAKMSPFWYAHKINEPILLIHGEADNNSGTFPIQSERFYVALKGHGVTARYVTLPHEAHGYAARESVLHTVAEMVNWADKYLKQAPRVTPTASQQD
jgi:dipeptidyl aminopeptidase/acylaminoacyl peptidase